MNMLKLLIAVTLLISSIITLPASTTSSKYILPMDASSRDIELMDVYKNAFKFLHDKNDISIQNIVILHDENSELGLENKTLCSELFFYLGSSSNSYPYSYIQTHESLSNYTLDKISHKTLPTLCVVCDLTTSKTLQQLFADLTADNLANKTWLLLYDDTNTDNEFSVSLKHVLMKQRLKL